MILNKQNFFAMLSKSLVTGTIVKIKILCKNKDKKFFS